MVRLAPFSTAMFTEMPAVSVMGGALTPARLTSAAAPTLLAVSMKKISSTRLTSIKGIMSTSSSSLSDGFFRQPKSKSTGSSASA